MVSSYIFHSGLLFYCMLFNYSPVFAQLTQHKFDPRTKTIRLPSLINNKIDSPLKTKMFKCIQIEDELYEEIDYHRTITSTDRSDEENENVEEPYAREIYHSALENHPKRINFRRISTASEKPSWTATTTSHSHWDKSWHYVIPNRNMDTSMKNQLVSTLSLSSQQCQQILHLANTYGIKNVAEWVGNNCILAQLYLPYASCKEIIVLVKSCNTVAHNSQ